MGAFRPGDIFVQGALCPFAASTPNLSDFCNETGKLCGYVKVTGLMMQGRADGHEWVKSFLVSYSVDSINWYYIDDQYANKLV